MHRRSYSQSQITAQKEKASSTKSQTLTQGQKRIKRHSLPSLLPIKAQSVVAENSTIKLHQEVKEKIPTSDESATKASVIPEQAVSIGGFSTIKEGSSEDKPSTAQSPIRTEELATSTPSQPAETALPAVDTLKANQRLKLPFEPSSAQCQVYFPPEEWEERETCWISLAPQGGEKWKEDRLGKVEKPEGGWCNTRVTGSNFGTAAGRSRFSTAEELAKEIAGLKEKQFSPEAIARMRIGTIHEPVARKWYEKKTGLEVRE
jgi:hypothetical protein